MVGLTFVPSGEVSPSFGSVVLLAAQQIWGRSSGRFCSHSMGLDGLARKRMGFGRAGARAQRLLAYIWAWVTPNSCSTVSRVYPSLEMFRG